MTNSQEKNSLKMNISGRVKNLRESNGLNQTQFAEKIGVKQSFISKVEKNIASFTIDQIILLRNVFEFDINWLLIGEGIIPQAKSEHDLEEILKRILMEGDTTKHAAVRGVLTALDPGEIKPDKAEPNFTTKNTIKWDF